MPNPADGPAAGVPVVDALAAGALAGGGVPAPVLAAAAGPVEEEGGDSAELSPGGDESIVVVVDLGDSTVRVVLDAGDGAAVVCTVEEPAGSALDPPGAGSEASMFSVRRSSWSG